MFRYVIDGYGSVLNLQTNVLSPEHTSSHVWLHARASPVGILPPLPLAPYPPVSGPYPPLLLHELSVTSDKSGSMPGNRRSGIPEWITSCFSKPHREPKPGNISKVFFILFAKRQNQNQGYPIKTYKALSSSSSLLSLVSQSAPRVRYPAPRGVSAAPSTTAASSASPNSSSSWSAMTSGRWGCAWLRVPWGTSAWGTPKPTAAHVSSAAAGFNSSKT